MGLQGQNYQYTRTLTAGQSLDLAADGFTWLTILSIGAASTYQGVGIWADGTASDPATIPAGGSLTLEGSYGLTGVVTAGAGATVTLVGNKVS